MSGVVCRGRETEGLTKESHGKTVHNSIATYAIAWIKDGYALFELGFFLRLNNGSNKIFETKNQHMNPTCFPLSGVSNDNRHL